MPSVPENPLFSLEGLSLLEDKKKRGARCICFVFFRDVRSRLIDFEVRREVASSQVTRIVIRSAFLELAADAADATDPPEVTFGPAARSLPSSRTVARMTGVKQTPSNQFLIKCRSHLEVGARNK